MPPFSLRLFATIFVHIVLVTPAPDGSCSPSSRTPIAAAQTSAEQPRGALAFFLEPMVPSRCCDCPGPHYDLRLVGGSSQPGLAGGPAELKSTGPESRHRVAINLKRRQLDSSTNHYNENDGVSTLVQEMAFGIVICFAASHRLSGPGPVRAHRDGCDST